MHYECPECGAKNSSLYDEYLDEEYCSQCGLVLVAPPVCGIVFPGMKHIVRKVILNRIK